VIYVLVPTNILLYVVPIYVIGNGSGTFQNPSSALPVNVNAPGELGVELARLAAPKIELVIVELTPFGTPVVVTLFPVLGLVSNVTPVTTASAEYAPENAVVVNTVPLVLGLAVTMYGTCVPFEMLVVVNDTVAVCPVATVESFTVNPNVADLL
jgi:hypothetical protein